MSAGRKPGPRRELTDADLTALVILRRGPAHGHSIWTQLSAAEVEDWAAVSRAQVYYSLGKLAERGLIGAAPGSVTETRRERQSWRITPEGRRALAAALGSPHWATRRVVPPFLTWVALSQLARPAARRKILQRREEHLQAEQRRERETLAGLRALPAEAEGADVAILMVEHVLRQLALERRLVEEVRALHEA